MLKTAILLFTFVGVAPAVLLSAFLLYSGMSMSRHADFRRPEARQVSLGQRMHSVIFLQGRKLSVDTVLWLPLLVILFGLAFIVTVLLMGFAVITDATRHI